MSDVRWRHTMYIYTRIYIYMAMSAVRVYVTTAAAFSKYSLIHKNGLTHTFVFILIYNLYKSSEMSWCVCSCVFFYFNLLYILWMWWINNVCTTASSEAFYSFYSYTVAIIYTIYGYIYIAWRAHASATIVKLTKRYHSSHINVYICIYINYIECQSWRNHINYECGCKRWQEINKAYGEIHIKRGRHTWYIFIRI